MSSGSAGTSGGGTSGFGGSSIFGNRRLFLWHGRRLLVRIWRFPILRHGRNHRRNDLRLAVRLQQHRFRLLWRWIVNGGLGGGGGIGGGGGGFGGGGQGGSGQQGRARGTQVADLGNNMRIVADPSNNALIIMAKAQEYRDIETVIKQLDVMPLQVLIDATIVEVDLTDSLQYGLQWFSPIKTRASK